jgi:hypothetical protein
MHEYGHYLQSQIIGPFYLPVIAVPSLVDAGILHQGDNWGHHQTFMESWADDLALGYFGDAYQETWDHYHTWSREEYYTVFHSAMTAHLSPYVRSFFASTSGYSLDVTSKQLNSNYGKRSSHVQISVW